MLVRGIDLSVGPVMSLVTAIVSYLAVADSGLDTTTTILVCLAVGLLVGLINAALTVWLRIPDLIATLATYSLFYGVVLIVRPAPGGLVSLSFIDTIGAQFGWVPAAAVASVLMYILAEACLIRGRIGQRLYATGSAPEAAAAIGIRPALVRSAAYVFCGLMAAAAGLVLAARIGSGDPQAGSAYTLSSITAVVIGGTSVFGGRGTAVATLLGAIAVGVMQNALNLMHVSAYWQYVWTGLLTLLAVSAYSMRLPRRAGPA